MTTVLAIGLGLTAWTVLPLPLAVWVGRRLGDGGAIVAGESALGPDRAAALEVAAG
jgi:hypothetical protein